MSDDKTKHTPGPWRWELNKSSNNCALVGGKPMFDKKVMGFARYGFSGAAPTFNTVPGTDYNIMVRVDKSEWAEPFPGRAHHADWQLNINHPDANLIAAAPDLFEALREMVESDGLGGGRGDSLEDAMRYVDARKKAVKLLEYLSGGREDGKS